MSVGVSHSYGGNVVVVDLANGRRWDMTPSMAEEAARQCLEIVDRGGCAMGVVIMAALDDRQFRFAGSMRDLALMVADLRLHADAARKRVAMQQVPT